MQSLSDVFIGQTQRVTAHILYFIPLEEGRGPLKIAPTLLGEASREVPHRNVLQTYTEQFDDAPDFADERLVRVFQNLVMAQNGVVRIQNPVDRLAIMTEASGSKIKPIVIPRPNEMANAHLRDEIAAFKTLIPFPAVRKFLQYWQENLDGPLYEVRLITSAIYNNNWRNAAMNATLN